MNSGTHQSARFSYAEYEAFDFVFHYTSVVRIRATCAGKHVQLLIYTGVISLLDVDDGP
jgi:hypothetical protein